MTEDNQKQPNMQDHSEKGFLAMIQQGLSEGGIHLTASKGFGKTRLLFSMAQQLRSLENCRVFIFDGSEAWFYGYSRIPVFTVSECDIQVNEVKTIEEIEQYSLNNWNLVKLAFESEKDLLFRLKTRKPSKRGFFIRTVINYLDAQQRAERERNADNEPLQNIAFFIEEAQDAFNARSQTRLESEEFLTVFNESRNQKEAFYTASQRLNDFSKTIRTKQNYVLGRINLEDKNPALRAIERQFSIDLSKMPLRTWFYNGETFISPTWKQQGKPYKINRAIREKWFKSTQPEPQPEQPIKPLSLFEKVFPILQIRRQKQRRQEQENAKYEAWKRDRLSHRTLEDETEEPEPEQPLSEEDREAKENGYSDANEEMDSDLIEFEL